VSLILSFCKPDCVITTPVKKAELLSSKVGVTWLVWIFLDFRATIAAAPSASSYVTNVVITGASVGIQITEVIMLVSLFFLLWGDLFPS
jgi:hypothetical protein